ncbi:MAG TPA: hypothetical protein VGN74_01615 [Brevundimonas sp.]|jgi:hypothetical protein|uniref:HAAS signaling domain-containing protein n=1 Tax=Brevundimonas sp. TaxID=1871086 RepID=UPI002E15F7F3|nr:hypothetical protein [Brevundimonas sp.]
MSAEQHGALLARYLKVVAAHLPASQRDDVIAELRDEIESRLEARAAELGRPLQEAEVEAVLREVGHPLSVAARYRPGPRHVVGPELYPYWRFAIRAGGLVLVFLTALGLVVRIAGGDPEPGLTFGQSIASLFNGVITLIGFVTLAAYIFERQSERPRWLHDWRVKDLGIYEFSVGEDWVDGLTARPKADASPASGAATARVAPRRTTTGEALGNIVAWAVVLLWWTTAFRIPGLHPVEWVYVRDGVDWGALGREVFTLVYWPVIAFGLSRIVFDLGRALCPSARVFAALGEAAFALGRVAFAGWLWFASPLSPQIAVDSVSAFIDRAVDGWTPSFDTAGIVMTIVAFAGVAGVMSVFAALGKLGQK